MWRSWLLLLLEKKKKSSEGFSLESVGRSVDLVEFDRFCWIAFGESWTDGRTAGMDGVLLWW